MRLSAYAMGDQSLEGTLSLMQCDEYLIRNMNPGLG